jgi:hypothetical protein
MERGKGIERVACSKIVVMYASWWYFECRAFVYEETSHNESV